MTKGQGIPDVDVIIRKKPGGNTSGNTKTSKDGWFTFDNLPFGTYNLTFAAPKLSPALAGKVEYLVIIEHSQIGSADSSTAKTYTGLTPNTARVSITKIAEGFDFTVGAEPQKGGINTSKSNVKNSPMVTGDQTRKAKDSQGGGTAPEARTVRGKIFLVETGTTNIMSAEEGIKTTSAVRSTMTEKAPLNTSSAPRGQNYRLTISFYSIGSGTDGNARNSLNEYLSRYEKAKAIKLVREEVRWGREGEVDYCLQLTEIAAKEQESVIADIKSLLKKSRFVRIEENAPCKNKQ